MGSGSRAAMQPVMNDLQRIFGERLEALVAYGWRDHGPVPSLALVRSVTIEDLNGCATRTSAWHKAGAATPLLLTSVDFARSLDAFPIEYGEILATHELVFGKNPFDGLSIRGEDLRRACEVQVKSHLLHLREDYLEGGGRAAAVEALVRESAPGFAALLRNLARLDAVPTSPKVHLITWAARHIGLNEQVVGDMLSLENHEGVPAVDSLKLFPAYLSSMERLAGFVDRWREA